MSEPRGRPTHRMAFVARGRQCSGRRGNARQVQVHMRPRSASGRQRVRATGGTPRDTVAMGAAPDRRSSCVSRFRPRRRADDGAGRAYAARTPGGEGERRAMRVALVDPSLFTLPYDRMLALGLQQAGHDVVLHARALEPREGEAEGVALAADFYRATGGARTAWLPAPAAPRAEGGRPRRCPWPRCSPGCGVSGRTSSTSSGCRCRSWTGASCPPSRASRRSC